MSLIQLKILVSKVFVFNSFIVLWVFLKNLTRKASPSGSSALAAEGFHSCAKTPNSREQAVILSWGERILLYLPCLVMRQAERTLSLSRSTLGTVSHLLATALRGKEYFLKLIYVF